MYFKSELLDVPKAQKTVTGFEFQLRPPKFVIINIFLIRDVPLKKRNYLISDPLLGRDGS
jgi:hypothetical protein